jgi:hypothetical protein
VTTWTQKKKKKKGKENPVQEIFILNFKLFEEIGMKILEYK